MESLDHTALQSLVHALGVLRRILLDPTAPQCYKRIHGIAAQGRSDEPILVLARVLHGDGTTVAVDPLVAATLARRQLRERPGAPINRGMP
jgi:hypothetical protein